MDSWQNTTQWSLISRNWTRLSTGSQSQWTNSNSIKVDKSDLRKGDLVFFKNTYNSNHTDGVSHVGIYIGNNEFIHLSSSKDVTISSLSNSYYSSHYLGAKRVTGVYATSEDTNFVNTSSVVNIGVKDWLKDQGESITRYVVIVLITLLAIIFLALSVFNLE